APAVAGSAPNSKRNPVVRTSSAARIDNQDAAYQSALAAQRKLFDQVTPVSDEMLSNPPPGDWLMWRGGYSTLGYSPLRQINKDTVRNLGVAWTLALPPSANEAAPLVHDGVLFIESANTIEAVNAVDGSILWRYIRPLPQALENGREARMKGL